MTTELTEVAAHHKFRIDIPASLPIEFAIQKLAFFEQAIAHEEMHLFRIGGTYLFDGDDGRKKAKCFAVGFCTDEQAARAQEAANKIDW